MSELSSDSPNKRKGLGRGLGSLLGGAATVLHQRLRPKAHPLRQQRLKKQRLRQLIIPHLQHKNRLHLKRQMLQPPLPKLLDHRHRHKQPPPTPAQAKPEAKAAVTPAPSQQPQFKASPAPAATPAPAPVENVAPHAGDKIWTINIEKLKSGKYQPRKSFERDALDELARSIKEHGILQPIVVRPNPNGTFEIVAGSEDGDQPKWPVYMKYL